MPTRKFKDRLKKLPFAYKMVGVGAILGMLSVFLPWYLDVDKFNSGYQFLGITGPLYLIGATLLVSFGISLVFVISRLFHKDLISMPLKEHTFHLANSSLSFYLIFVAYSIYFHPQFGLHIIDKQPRFGFLMAVIACAITGYGGYLQRKQYLLAHKNAHTIEDCKVVEKETYYRDHQNVSNIQERAVKNIREESRDPQKQINATVNIPIKSEIRSPEDKNDLTSHYDNNWTN